MSISNLKEIVMELLKFRDFLKKDLWRNENSVICTHLPAIGVRKIVENGKKTDSFWEYLSPCDSMISLMRNDGIFDMLLEGVDTELISSENFHENAANHRVMNIVFSLCGLASLGINELLVGGPSMRCFHRMDGIPRRNVVVGSIDSLLLDQDGKVVVAEYKTSHKTFDRDYDFE